MLAQHKGRVLIGMAARPGGPVEVAALGGETPISSEDLSFAVDGKPVTAAPCGRACSRLDVDAFNGARRRITVNAPDRFEFVLPKALPVSESRLFARVQREMRSLRTYRYAEELTSSAGGGLRSTFEVRAPNRLAFRTGDGFRSIIIGRNRWDFRNGRWERSAFPGLRVPTYMWDGARNARSLGSTRYQGGWSRSSPSMTTTHSPPGSDSWWINRTGSSRAHDRAEPLHAAAIQRLQRADCDPTTEMTHHHRHGLDRTRSRRALGAVLALTAAYTVVELVGGLATDSLALLQTLVTCWVTRGRSRSRCSPRGWRLVRRLHSGASATGGPRSWPRSPTESPSSRSRSGFSSKRSSGSRTRRRSSPAGCSSSRPSGWS